MATRPGGGGGDGAPDDITVKLVPSRVCRGGGGGGGWQTKEGTLWGGGGGCRGEVELDSLTVDGRDLTVEDGEGPMKLVGGGGGGGIENDFFIGQEATSKEGEEGVGV